MRKTKMRLRAIWLIITSKHFILLAFKIKNGCPVGSYVCRTDFSDETDVLLVESQLERMRKTKK